MFFFPTIVQSWGLAESGAPWDAILAKVGGVFVVVEELVLRGWLLIWAGDLVSVLALFSICLVAVSR